MTPSVAMMDEGTLWVSENVEEAVKKYTLRKPAGNRHYVAVGNGLNFEAMKVRIWQPYPNSKVVIAPIGEDESKEQPHEHQMLLHYPIDPRIEIVDVHGAVRAYPNDDNDGWLFEHVNEGQHHDHFLRPVNSQDIDSGYPRG